MAGTSGGVLEELDDRRRTALAVAPHAFFSPLLEPHRPRAFCRRRSFMHLEIEEMAGGKGSRQGHRDLMAALWKIGDVEP